MSTTSKTPPEGSFGRVLLDTLNGPETEYSDIKLLLKNKNARLLLPLSAYTYPQNSTNKHGRHRVSQTQLEDHIVTLGTEQEHILPFLSLSGILGRIEGDALYVEPTRNEALSRTASKLLMTPAETVKLEINKAFSAQIELENPSSKTSDTQDTHEPTTDTTAAAEHTAAASPKPPSEGKPPIAILYKNVELPLPGHISNSLACIIISGPSSTYDTAEEENYFDDIPKDIMNDINKVLLTAKSQSNKEKSLDGLADTLQNFLEDITQKLAASRTTHAQESSPTAAPPSRIDADRNANNDMLEKIERHICTSLYDIFFLAAVSIDRSNDETLESRIAALNILDLTLEHLGVTSINAREEQAMMTAVIHGGQELQKMMGYVAPADKLQSIVNCHKLIATTLDAPALKKPAKETRSEDPQKSAKETSNEGPQKPDGNLPSDSATKEEQPERQNSSADLMLPLLIYIVVKSNPPKLISNLRYIQRFRNRNFVRGEASYCLTNMMAVVSFLENVDMAVLGLSQAGNVILGDTDDKKTTNAKVLAAQRVGKEIAEVAEGVADAGSKVLTGVVDMSSKVLGKFSFWGGNNGSRPPTPSNRAPSALQRGALLIDSSKTSFPVPSILTPRTRALSFSKLVSQARHSSPNGNNNGSQSGISGQEMQAISAEIAAKNREMSMLPESAYNAVNAAHHESTFSNQRKSFDRPSAKNAAHPHGGSDGSSSRPPSGLFLSPRNERPSTSPLTTTLSSVEAAATLSAPAASANVASTPSSYFTSNLLLSDSDPPIQRFVDAGLGDLRISDLPELLADYKRLAAIVRKQPST